ncbi:putative toxin-antitoxin system toxin component, PIN family [Candidatus Endobugula sertula]|uniref:Putative toxin-antitoxin system toxin component, PIN family n=1 Tax=Candidatus Endobugula sertula TaxID=62101 RepID=A0A1D2QR93_9GAMM|nr:putative toxin-antitoxin system toxin component, PIN family [Candidatus Endobugula sertula]
MRIVLDTGILVSALITKDTPPDWLYQSWCKQAFTLVTSEEQLEEIKRVLSYKKLERFINQSEAQILLEALHRKADIATDLPFVELSPDPDDNRIIATALAGQADYLVSGDKADLLSLGMAHDIPILTARQMAERLKLG